MSIYCISFGKWFDKVVQKQLIDSFPSSISSSSFEFSSQLSQIVSNTLDIPRNERGIVTFVVDVDDEDSINSILTVRISSFFIYSSLLTPLHSRPVLQVLQRIPCLLNYIRIIAISTLLTWGGKSYNTIITNIDAEFQTRRPVASAGDAYLTENALFNFAKRTKAQVTILSLGLIYGADGYDFKDLFK